METEGPFQTPWTQQAKAAKLLQRAAPKSKMQTGDELDVSMSNFLVLLQRINQRRERIWPDSMCRTELLQCFSNIKDGLKIPSFWQGAGLNTNAFSNRTHLLGILSAFQLQKKHQHHLCLAGTAYRHTGGTFVTQCYLLIRHCLAIILFCTFDSLIIARF